MQTPSSFRQSFIGACPEPADELAALEETGSSALEKAGAEVLRVALPDEPLTRPSPLEGLKPEELEVALPDVGFADEFAVLEEPEPEVLRLALPDVGCADDVALTEEVAIAPPPPLMAVDFTPDSELAPEDPAVSL